MVRENGRANGGGFLRGTLAQPSSESRDYRDEGHEVTSDIVLPVGPLPVKKGSDTSSLRSSELGNEVAHPASLRPMLVKYKDSRHVSSGLRPSYKNCRYADIQLAQAHVTHEMNLFPAIH